MKWLLISYTLFILSFGAIHAESGEDQDDVCYRKWHVQYMLELSCLRQQFNMSDPRVAEEFQTVILEYSGNNASVQATVDNYCPRFYKLLECTLITQNTDPECQDPLKLERRQQEYYITKGMLDYACADSGAVVVQLLQNNGIEMVYENNEVRQCLTLIYGTRKITVEKVEPYISTCDGINQAFECITDLVRDHANPNLVAIANDVRLVFRRGINCAAENEL